MEKIFRKILEYDFTNEQTVALFRMAFEYKDTGDIETGPEDLQMCFLCNIAPLLDKLEKDRQRKRKERLKGNEREKGHID